MYIFKIYFYLFYFIGYFNGSFSGTLPVISGVPQGSVLGPLLFVIYIDDIVNLVRTSSSANTSDVFLYADDAKLFSHNAAQLQCDLDNLASWLLNCQLYHLLNVNIWL